MSFEIDLQGDGERDSEGEFRELLRQGRHDRALEIAEQGAADPNTDDWRVTSMLESIGLSLAATGKYEEAIASFERALELDWNVVPDGRCEIARVLLEAGCHDEADALWRELRHADPEEASFRARNDFGETTRVAAGRALDRRLGIPPRSTSLEATWLREEDDLEARPGGG